VAPFIVDGVCEKALKQSDSEARAETEGIKLSFDGERGKELVNRRKALGWSLERVRDVQRRVY
jgi:hypothetical protein